MSEQVSIEAYNNLLTERNQLQKQIEQLTHERNSYKLRYKIAQDVFKNLDEEITMLHKDCTRIAQVLYTTAAVQMKYL